MPIYYRGGYKYQLAAQYDHTLPDAFAHHQISTRFFKLFDGVLTVLPGYAWDGPSGPAFDTKTGMRASLVHDCLYQAMRMWLVSPNLRGDADRELYRICIEDGMLRFRAWVWHQMLIRFGDANVRNESRREIIVAGVMA